MHAVLLEITLGDADRLGRDALALEVLRGLDLRIVRDGHDPAHGPHALLGVDEIGDFVHVRAVFDDPVIAGQAGVQHAVFDVTADLLCADQARFDLRIIDARNVGARAGRNREARLLHHRERGLLQAAFGQTQDDFFHSHDCISAE